MPAIRWLVEHAASNEELARLSNVSNNWRMIVGDTILDEAKKSLSGKENSVYSLLLLPSLVRSLMRQELADSRDVETFCLSWFHPEGIQSKQLPLDPTNDTDEEEDEMMKGYHKRGDSPEHFAPSGQESYVGSEEERSSPSRRRRSKSPNPVTAFGGDEKSKEDYVHCLYQWNSYKEAKEILHPFGFSAQFIQVSDTLNIRSHRDHQIDSHFCRH